MKNPKGPPHAGPYAKMTNESDNGDSVQRLVGPLIVVTELERTCISMPAQWSGWTDDHRRVYVRYRWGYLSVRVGKAEDESEYAGVRGEEIFGKQLRDPLHGLLELEELMSLTEGIVKWPNDCKLDAPAR